MEDYKRFIELLVGLASGEFDPQNLYRMGYPTEYSIDVETSDGCVEKRVMLQAQGSLPLPDISAIPIMHIGVSQGFYGTGKAYIPPYEAEPMVARFFREGVDLEQLKRDFGNVILSMAIRSKACPPLFRKLVESGANITGKLINPDTWLMVTLARGGPLGYAAITYEEGGEEEGVPKHLGELVYQHY